MVNLNKYFDRIYVINLDKRQDRYQSFLNEMNRLSIDGVKRFSAIDGSVIQPPNKSILPGELGILLTHLEIIKECKKDNLNNVLIMEDDVYFTDEIYDIDNYMLKLPEDWDLLYFGGNHHYGNNPLNVNDKILKLNFTVALQCIGIKNTMFDQIILKLSESLKPVDVYYAEFQKENNSYCFKPNIAKQKPGYSNIQNRIVDYSNFF
jgi:GR25 family glycosyltransferase involved in LPS biosynthesis